MDSLDAKTESSASPGAHEAKEATRLEHEARRIAQARQATAAGRVIPLADIQSWADSLGKADALPMPTLRTRL
jgi:hypothetical protein